MLSFVPSARTDGKLWVMNRQIFQTIMLKNNEETMEHNLNIVRRIEIFKDLSDEVLLKICDLIMVVRVKFKLR